MRGQFATVLVGSIAAALLCAAGFAGAQETPIKQRMGENFAGMQIILSSLMTTRYAAAPDQVAIIADHASYLLHAVPDSVREDRDQFLVYAANLQGHAHDLKSIIELLIEHDGARASDAMLETIDLREAAAAHYGGMAIMCVACHNHFRRQVVR